MSLNRAFWPVFALMAANYLVMLFWSLPQLTIGDLLPFDLRPGGYTLTEARAYLAALDETATRFYLEVQHRLDMVYPGLLGLTLILAYLRLFPRLWAAGFSVVAAAAAVLDWSENRAVAELLRLGAERIDAGSVEMAARLTMLKSGAVTAALAILLAGLAGALWRRVRR